MSKSNLKRLLIAGAITFALLVGIVAGTHISGQSFTSSVTQDVLTGDAVESAVNEYRTSKGIEPLTSNGSLDESAQARAEFLCKNNVWSHEGWVDSVAEYRATAVKVGENLQYGDVNTLDTRTIVGSWAASPTHDANMADSSFVEQGMGVTYCRDYQEIKEAIIVVNHFGRPL